MAEKTIGIRIQLNGMNTVVQDIQTFEQLLKEAKEDLKQIPIGEQNFKKLANEISTAESQLTKLNESARGLSGEKISEGLSKFGSGIASSFAAATAAVSLFGTESEEVSKAATQAQNLLTLALSARGIMELRTGAAITARAIATRAATAAETTNIAVLKQLYAVLAANPYTAIIAVIGALVAAYALLRQETEDLSAEIESLSGDFDTLKMAQEDYLTTIKQTTEEALAIAEKDKASTQEILQIKLDSIQQQIEALQDARIKNEQFVDSINELNLKQAQNEGKSIEEIKKIQLQGAQAKQKIIRDSENAIEVLRSQKRILLINNEKDNNQKLEKLEQERLARRRKAILDSYNKELELLKKVEEQIIATQSKSLEYTTTVTDKQKDILDKQADFIKTRNETLLTDAERLQKSLSDLLLKTLPDTTDLSKIEDSYSKLFEVIDKGIRSGKLDFRKSTGWEDFVKFADEQLPGIGAKLTNVNEEAKTSFVEYFNNLDNRLRAIFQEVNKNTKVLKDFFSIDPTIDQLETLRQVEELITKTREERLKTGKSEFEIEQESIKIIKERFNITTKINEKQTEITNLRFNNEQLISELNKTTDEARKTELNNQLAQNNELIGTLQAQGEEYDKIAKAIFDGIQGTSKFVIELKKIGIEIDNNSKKIKSNKDEIDAALDPTQYEGLAKIFEDNAQNYAELVRFLITNQQALLEKLGPVGINTVLQGLSTGISKIDNLTKTQLQELINYLKLSQEELGKTFNISEQAFAELIDKLTKKLKQMPNELSDATKKVLENLSEALQFISTNINKLASIEAQRLQLQLDKATRKYEDDLKDVVGETEQANQKRLELEEQYQKQKAEIEKRAAVRALQFQLAQAIAEGAQAVIANAANPVLAAIVAGIAIYQVSVIRQQLQFAQSLAGGGRIRMGAGGMVVGPSHEMGGVSYPMGVNLEGGETVINRTSSLAYGDLLSSVNQMGGGQPIISNATNTLMEERLIQAIAKTRSTPIRAYVLEQDITRSQTIQRKLDQLATL